VCFKVETSSKSGLQVWRVFAPAHNTGVMRRQIRAPSVPLPEIVIPSASANASLQSPTGTLLVLWPESFRGGCSFGTVSNRFLPTRSNPDNGEGRILARAYVATKHIFVALASSSATGAAKSAFAIFLGSG
jgi:hypothetical protein